jgi:hypothetical protein
MLICKVQTEISLGWARSFGGRRQRRLKGQEPDTLLRFAKEYNIKCAVYLSEESSCPYNSSLLALARTAVAHLCEILMPYNSSPVDVAESSSFKPYSM